LLGLAIAPGAEPIKEKKHFFSTIQNLKYKNLV